MKDYHIAKRVQSFVRHKNVTCLFPTIAFIKYNDVLMQTWSDKECRVNYIPTNLLKNTHTTCRTDRTVMVNMLD